MTHPELKATFSLPIIGVKKNPSSPLYTQLGVLTKVLSSATLRSPAQALSDTSWHSWACRVRSLR